MAISQHNIDSVTLRLAQDESEIRAAQHLRYKVFYEECKAKPTVETLKEKRDMDRFDDIADHLIVIDESRHNGDRIVGTYRLLRQDVADKNGGFYTSGEYDIAPLLSRGRPMMELGRSCVLPAYRTRPVMQLLWEGIIGYMFNHEMDTLFGCVSFPGTDVSALSKQLAYLHHYHRIEENIRPRALPEHYVDINLHAKEDLDEKQIFADLPALIKGYLRIGCKIGDGAFIDRQFNTTDVCIIMTRDHMTSRYRRHYHRKINIPLYDTPVENSDSVSQTDGAVCLA